MGIKTERIKRIEEINLLPYIKSNTYKQLADKFKVHPITIRNIIEKQWINRNTRDLDSSVKEKYEKRKERGVDEWKKLKETPMYQILMYNYSKTIKPWA